MARSRSNGCTASVRYRSAANVVPARTGANATVEAGEEVGTSGEHLGAAPHLERTAGERVLRPQPALVERAGGGAVGDERRDRRGVAGVDRTATEAPSGPIRTW